MLLDRPLAFSPYNKARIDYDGHVSNRHAPLVRAHAVRFMQLMHVLWHTDTLSSMRAKYLHTRKRKRTRTCAHASARAHTHTHTDTHTHTHTPISLMTD
jgi:hypothetical protein